MATHPYRGLPRMRYEERHPLRELLIDTNHQLGWPGVLPGWSFMWWGQPGDQAR
ncbi:MAG: hypothetical protein ACKOJF_20420 [Planctomycetaceae bacterium]